MPALGGETISPRWPLPIGLTRLIRRWLRFLGSVSRLISSIGWMGVSASKMRPALGRLRVDAVDRLDAQQAPVLLAVLGLADDAAYTVAGAQAEAADLRLDET